MKLYWVVPIVLVLSLLLRAITKVIDKQLRKSTGKVMFHQAAAKAVVEFVLKFCLVAVVTYSVLWAGLWSYWYFAGREPSHVLEQLEKSRAVFERIDAFYGYIGWMLMLLCAVCILVIGRRAKASLQGRLNEHYETELRRLKEERASGIWDELPPSSDMQAAENALTEVGSAKTRILASLLPMDAKTAELVRINKAIESLKLRLLALDFERRMKQFVWDPASAYRNEAEQSLGRSAKWLTGAKVLFGWKYGTDKISVVGLALAAAAFVGVASGTVITPNITKDISHMWDLRLLASEREARASWDNLVAGAASDQNVQLNKDDEIIINQISRSFEQQFVASPQWQFRNNFSASSLDVRRRLIQEAEAKSTNRLASAKEDGAANAPETATVALGGAAIDDESQIGPETEIGRVFRSELKNDFAKLPHPVWAAIKRKIEAEAEILKYSSLPDVGQIALGEIWGKAVDLGFQNKSGAGLAIGQSALEDIPSDVLDRAYEVRSKQFLSALATSASYSEALDVARKQSWQFPALSWSDDQRVKDWLTRQAELNGTRPVGFETAIEIGSDPNAIEAAALDLNQYLAQTEKGEADTAQDIIDSLESYQDLLPNDAVRPATLYTRFLEKTGTPEKPEDVSKRVAIARNYESLKGFSKTGGILLGVQPSLRAPINVTGFRWTHQADGLTLLLKLGSGDDVSLGPYPASLIAQAIAFAADGRPTAVTIMNAGAVDRFRIFLHPAFIDTPLGTDLIATDEWIFHFTTGSHADPQVRRTIDGAMKHINTQLTLYDATWHLWHAVAYKQRKEFDGAIYRLWPITQVDGEYAEAASHWQEWSNRDLSPLARKPIYVREVVAQMQMCAQRSPAAMVGFVECVVQASKPDGTLRQSLAQKVTAIPTPPVYDTFSHFRERPFDADANLNFVKAPIGQSVSDELWPFELLIQTTFNDKPGIYVDPDPWKLDQYTSTIESSVAGAIQADSNRQRILAELRDLTVLQRLFRLAFDGGLGSSFPLDRLYTLEEVTSTTVPYSHTLRWTSARDDAAGLDSVELGFKESLKEGVDSLQKFGTTGSDDPWFKEPEAQMKRCIVLIQSSGSPHTIPTENWEKTCGLTNFSENVVARLRGADDLPNWQSSPEGVVRLRTDLAGTVVRERRLRDALNIWKDDEQYLKEEAHR